MYEAELDTRLRVMTWRNIRVGSSDFLGRFGFFFLRFLEVGEMDSACTPWSYVHTLNS